MDEVQQIKAHLVILAEYLQVTLTEPQILLYARELEDLGPSGLNRAIAVLKADASVWTGRFPLPAKIRSYLSGDLESKVALSMRRIMSVDTAAQAYELPKVEYDTMKTYGLNAILERNAHSTPTIYAQLRDLLRVAYTDRSREERLGLPDRTNPSLFETQSPALSPSQNGERSLFQTGQARPGPDTWED